MKLIKTEVNRFFSRRFMIVMLLALLAAFGCTVFTVLSASETPDARQWAHAREAAVQQREYLDQKYRECRAIFDERRCADLNPAHVETEDFIYGTFNFRREITGLMFALAAFLCLYGYLVTASFIGAELHSGGMTNLLLWRPDRKAVLAAKLGVALAAVTVISAVFSVIYVGTFYGIAATSGWVGYLSADFWSDLVELGLRNLGLTFFASVIAFAIATIGRHTAAALGALMGYIVVWEGGARLIATIVAPDASHDPWFLSSHIAAWLSGGYRYWSSRGESFLDWSESGLVLAGIALVFGAITFGSFVRRDIA